jgi:hypothetical protein
VASSASMQVTRPSARGTWLFHAVRVWALPAASGNITAAVTAVHAIPPGLCRGVVAGRDDHGGLHAT